MNHGEMKEGMLRAYLDGELDAAQVSTVEDHVKGCSVCQAEVATLRSHAERVRDGLDRLPELAGANNTAMAWAAFAKKREDWMDREPRKWTWWQTLSLAGGGLGVAAVVLILTVAPVRAWAESLLAIFRVEHFTVLELNPSTFKGNGLQNNQLLNQTIGHVLSDEVTVTQSPQKPRLVADAATASSLAGFPVQLLPGETPSSLLLESGVGMQMKLDRDHIQSILDEAGRSDLQIPAAVDGATIGVRVPAGVMAFYGNCGDAASRLVSHASSNQGSTTPSATTGHHPALVIHVGGADKSNPAPSTNGSSNSSVESAASGGSQQTVTSGSDRSVPEADATCVSLVELPSPVVSAPQQIDPAQIAQVALQFLGMSANDAASFTQTVDWTSTLVLPVVRGETKYALVHVNGNEGALLRSARSSPSEHFTLMWVNNGIVFTLNGTGDDTTAVNLASQL